MITMLLNTLSLLVLALGAAQAGPAVTAQPDDAANGTAIVPLTAAEEADLLHMREEEKLAGDVYTALYDQWGLPIFANIAGAERTHAAAVLVLLDRYGLADPAADNPPGVFTDPDLQALYDELLAQGNQSLADALYVGATIEEVDIVDLQQALSRTTRADITAVYSNLLRGSGNHLRAFVPQWERVTGQTYTPQVLSAAEYAAIMDGQGAGNGNRRFQGRGPGNRGWAGGGRP